MNCNKKVKFEIATIILEEHQPKDSSWDVAAATDAKKMSVIISEFFTLSQTYAIMRFGLNSVRIFSADCWQSLWICIFFGLLATFSSRSRNGTCLIVREIFSFNRHSCWGYACYKSCDRWIRCKEMLWWTKEDVGKWNLSRARRWLYSLTWLRRKMTNRKKLPRDVGFELNRLCHSAWLVGENLRNEPYTEISIKWD